MGHNAGVFLSNLDYYCRVNIMARWLAKTSVDRCDSA
jgi:hypothetical protein